MAQIASPPLLPRKAYRKIGNFRATFYNMVDARQAQFATAPPNAVLLDASSNEIARVPAAFKAELEVEGTGMLADGRVVSFAGFKKSPGETTAPGKREAYYQVVTDAPFGFGVENYRLLPYRTAAVNPRQILIGSVLFVPQFYGVQLPSGEVHDGFFLAHDVGHAVKQDGIDLFVGREDGLENVLARSARLRASREVEVYLVQEPLAGSVRRRYREDFEYGPRPGLQEMVAKQIDSFIREVSGREPDLNRRLAVYSERAKGTPYVLFCLGEGPNGKYDRDPLMDFSRADCMTFCEQILALTISDNYADMFANLQRIRYQRGEVGFTTRNHYTHADWVPNNAWLLADATAEIGGSSCADMTKVIDRPAFFRKLGVPDSELAGVAPAQSMTIKYVPTANLSAIKSKLRGGEIASIVQKTPGIFSAHMGFIIRDRYDNVLFRNASSRPETQQVTDEFFDEVVAQLQQSGNRVGMVFLRLQPKIITAERASEP